MKQYIKDALKTETKAHGAIHKRLTSLDMHRLLHAGLGLTTESAEFIDALKKHIYYGKELDRVNLKEELGDIIYYCAIACDVLDTDFETIMETNIAKLKARYGDKFTEESAINRDLKTERKILEK